MTIESDVRCPCGSGLTYAECCGRLHTGAAWAPTAEALMRSRFSAFAAGDAAYLLRSWHPATRPVRLDLDADTVWTWLAVQQVHAGGLLDPEGTVSFTAHYRRAGVKGAMRENSRFVRHERLWVYVGPLLEA
jgi:SEC-C motif-containing protein